MNRLFGDLPQAIRATRMIAEKAEFTLRDLGYRFPDYPLPGGQSPAAELQRLVLDGEPSRYPDGTPPRVKEQIAHELALIDKLDLAGYFLIVWDIVRYCREQGILVQGRGSAANSAVCYVLGITAVDPVARGLLFERFLSEDRGEWPDIDLDLPSGPLREQAIQYLYERYGPYGAAMTANVITYRDRSAIRDVGKVLGYPPDVLDKVARRGMELDPADPKTGKFIQLLGQIQHLPRHLGQHSGGMVICKGRLDDIVPIEPATMPGRSVIAWDKDDCADLGILKIDLLGLGMMHVLQDCVPLIRETEGVEVDYGRLPQDDPAIWDMLCRADTVGVFQVESRAQMNILPRLQPKCFYDLAVSIGLVRPGPIVGQMVSPYLERRAGRQKVQLPHPDLEPVLARTMGIPIFQEQVMRMAMVMAGFTGAQAERLRRVMGFKRADEKMVAIEHELRAGMATRGIPAAQADEVIQYITSFAQYGFPEAHSLSFALIAYATCYLKVHHPAAFLTCLLNAWPMGFYHPATLIRDGQRHGIAVLPVDATRSQWNCSLETGAVRLGLRYVQGLRQSAAEQLVARRFERPFADLADLMRRCDLQGDELEQLATIGALGALCGDRSRRQALWQVQGLQDYRRGLLAGAEPPDDGFPLSDMDDLEALQADMKGMGVSAHAHPLEFARAALSQRGVVPAAAVPSAPPGRWIEVAGVVIVRNRPPTAKGMLFMTLEDETGLVNVAVDPHVFERYRSLLVATPALLLRGRVERRDGVTNLKVQQVEALDAAVFRSTSRDFR
ncbi:MAG: error-prone DNA polymerase, partial [Cyanobacteria bacterium REEB65]|nr:error-prone DNA polymerase [Cyanobacteria bacterium REEB65]